MFSDVEYYFTKKQRKIKDNLTMVIDRVGCLETQITFLLLIGNFCCYCLQFNKIKFSNYCFKLDLFKCVSFVNND